MVLTTLAGCDFIPVEDQIDQSVFCIVDTANATENKKKCKIGNKITFAPNVWGNEQQPVLFAVGNCDFRYSVALTTGAVACVFNPVSKTFGSDNSQ